MISPVLVFDIESIPDIAGLRALRGVPEAEYGREVAHVKETMSTLASGEPHGDEYLKAWA